MIQYSSVAQVKHLYKGIFGSIQELRAQVGRKKKKPYQESLQPQIQAESLCTKGTIFFIRAKLRKFKLGRKAFLKTTRLRGLPVQTIIQVYSTTISNIENIRLLSYCSSTVRLFSLRDDNCSYLRFHFITPYNQAYLTIYYRIKFSLNKLIYI